jgi:transcriptional regulator with XRE-family HTH domain
MYRPEVIRDEMSRQNMSVQDLAEQANLSRPTVYNLLDGKRKPTLETLQAVSRVLNIPLSSLIVEQAV